MRGSVLWFGPPSLGAPVSSPRDWLDYVERVGVLADADIHLIPLETRLDESELETLWPGGGGSGNLTGAQARRMRDLLNLTGPWRRARILWTREPYERELPLEVVHWP